MHVAERMPSSFEMCGASQSQPGSIMHASTCVSQLMQSIGMWPADVFLTCVPQQTRVAQTTSRTAHSHKLIVQLFPGIKNGSEDQEERWEAHGSPRFWSLQDVAQHTNPRELGLEVLKQRPRRSLHLCLSLSLSLPLSLSSLLLSFSLSGSLSLPPSLPLSVS